MDFQKKRVQILLSAIGIIALSITAEKCRQLVGEDASSQSGKFTILNCFDMGSGTMACGVKEGVKLYFNNIRAAHVERARNVAIEKAVADALSQGLSSQDASKQAQKEGAKAAKLAKQQAKRIIGPVIASGWDFFEAIYYGGTITEGFIRGTGTLLGTYSGGLIGEQSLGRLGYLVGSQLGSWIGGRIGLMVYDVVNGVNFLLQFVRSVEEGEAHETPAKENFRASDDSYASEAHSFRSSEAYEDSKPYDSPPYENSEYESYENSEL